MILRLVGSSTDRRSQTPFPRAPPVSRAPQADASIPITSIGVDKFVLCESSSGRPLLRVSFPEVLLQPRRRGEPAAAELILTCQPPVGAGETAVKAFDVIMQAVEAGRK